MRYKINDLLRWPIKVSIEHRRAAYCRHFHRLGTSKTTTVLLFSQPKRPGSSGISADTKPGIVRLGPHSIRCWGNNLKFSTLISAMCVCALGVRALLISVFCCFGPFCGRGRPQDLVERVGFEISCRNQGSLPSGIGSKAIFGVGDRPGGPSCVIRKNGLCVPQRPLKSRQKTR